jgi:glycine cleavage system H protein
LKFSKTHEYITVDNGTGTVGISQFAAEQLGDVVYVELPEPGKTYGQGEEFGVVESVKAVSSLYMPVSGKVVASNVEPQEHPEYVNQDPYGKGWMLKLELAQAGEIDALLAAEQYQAEVASH